MLALVVISVLVSLSAASHGVTDTQIPFLLVFLATINLSSFGLLLLIIIRVKNLRRDATKIAAGNDLSQRLRVLGTDELSDLAANFNVMLAALEEAQEYLVIARDAAEASDRRKSSLIEQLRRRDYELMQARSETISAAKSEQQSQG